MTIYIDYLFIQSFVLDFVILLQTKLLSKEKFKAYKGVIACIISGIYTCLAITLSLEVLNYFWCKIFLSFVIIYIAFTPKTTKKHIKLVSIFYLSSILNVGSAVFVSEILCEGKYQTFLCKIVVYCISLLVTYVVSEKFWQIYKCKINSVNLYIPVEVMLSGKKYMYSGFIDTGNTVYSYELGVPIVFAEYLTDEQKILVKKQEKTSVAVSTISKKSLEKAILVDGVIQGKRIKFGVVFVDSTLNKAGNYNMVLNFKLFEEKLGGICI